jgi:hypothetical protein
LICCAAHGVETPDIRKPSFLSWLWASHRIDFSITTKMDKVLCYCTFSSLHMKHHDHMFAYARGYRWNAQVKYQPINSHRLRNGWAYHAFKTDIAKRELMPNIGSFVVVFAHIPQHDGKILLRCAARVPTADLP